MTVRELMRRVALDGFRFVGVEDLDAPLPGDFDKDAEVLQIVVTTPKGILRLVPERRPR